MRAQTALNTLLVLGFLAVGSLGWWLMLRPPLEVDVRPLEALPTEIGGWGSSERALEPAVAEVLDADVNLQRTYAGPGSSPIWLYIGYYGTALGGRPQHVPRGCYTGAGWSIQDRRVLEVDPGSQLRVNEFLVQREGERRLVHFWYRSHRRTGMVGGFDQNVDRIVGRLGHGRADGALVRISTPVFAQDEVQARGRLMAFASELDPLLDEHWPVEHASR